MNALFSSSEPNLLKKDLATLNEWIASAFMTESEIISLLHATDSFVFLDRVGTILMSIDVSNNDFVSGNGLMQQFICTLMCLFVNDPYDPASCLRFLTSKYNVLKICLTRCNECEDEIVLQRIVFLNECLRSTPSHEIFCDQSIAGGFMDIVKLLERNNQVLFNAVIRVGVLMDYILPSQGLFVFYSASSRSAGSLSEAIILLANELSGKFEPLNVSILNLIEVALKNPNYQDFFFPSDILVFIDVVLREIRNLPVESSAIMEKYVRVLDGVLTWPLYKMKFFKNAEILDILNEVIAGCKDIDVCKLTIEVIEKHINILEKR